MLFTLYAVGPDHPLYVLPPKESLEHVYSAIEFPHGKEDEAIAIVCYRTKDKVTHQASVTSEGYTIRKSVAAFGK